MIARSGSSYGLLTDSTFEPCVESQVKEPMIVLILVVQILTLLTVLYLLHVILKITNVAGLLNSEQLSSVIKSGARIEAAAAEVAQDLSNAHARADAVHQGNYGEAADAASQQTEREKLANNNPKI